MSRLLPIGLIALAVLTVLVGASRAPARGELSRTATASARSPHLGRCKRVAKPAPSRRRFSSPKQVVTPGETLTAVVKTSCGAFRIALDSTRAPRTVNSFAFLAEKGFYDGLTFHRSVPGFVIQGGDPRGDGTGGPGYGVTETPPSDLAYTKGLVAMAKSSTEPPGRSGSQFFVVLGADVGLPPEYALVGRVSKGFDVVERIGRLGTRSERPRHTVLIGSISIRRGS